jgi:hypothetical protein
LKGYDEPEILRSQLSQFGPISADAGQLKPYSPGIKQQWEQFDQYLNDVIWRRRGPGPHNV